MKYCTYLRSKYRLYEIWLTGSTCKKELVAQIAAKYNIFPQMALMALTAPVMNLVGVDGNRSRGLTSGRGDSYTHNTRDV